MIVGPGCSHRESPPDAQRPVAPVKPIVAYADSPFPMEGLSDVVDLADQLSVFEVVSERNGEPEGGIEPYIPRYMSIRIEKNLWLGRRAKQQAHPDSPSGEGTSALQPEGAVVELVAWGSVVGGDSLIPRPIAVYGEPRLEVGGRYLSALISTEQGLATYPGTLAELRSGDVELAFGTETIVPKPAQTIDGVRDALSRTQPSSAAESLANGIPNFFELDPLERVELLQQFTTASDDVPAPTFAADGFGN